MSEALLIIDFQRDFTPPDGALAVSGGDEIAPRLNELARDPRYDLVVATRDWHPPDHSSFGPQGGPWPPHCIRGTPGAELHPALDREPLDAVIDKGQRVDGEGYSAFESDQLAALLREHDIDAVTVVGLATDYCVLTSARDALAAGLAVSVDRSATRAVNPDDGERAMSELRRLGATVD